MGEAGAAVYCTGRSVRGKPATPNRPETIDETAEIIDAAGGTAHAVCVDHADEEQVAALFERVRREQQRLTGRVLASWDLAEEYGFTDADGRRPHWGKHFEKTYGAKIPAMDEAFYARYGKSSMEIAFPDWP